MKLLRFLILPFILILNSCILQDHNIDPLNIPESVKKVISDKFPDASDISYTVLEKDRVYEANFKLNGKKFAAITSINSLLNSTEIPGIELPDDLKAKIAPLPIAGGSFKNYRIVTSVQNEITYLSDYVLNGDSYTLIFNNTRNFRNMVTHHETSYPASLENFQEKIQNFFSERSKPNPAEIQSTNLNQAYKDNMSPKRELLLGSGTVYILPGGKKIYKLTAQYYETTSLDLTFNENGDVIHSGSFDRLKKFNKTFDLVDNPTLFHSNISNEDQTFFNNSFDNKPYWKNLTVDANTSSNWKSEYASVTSFDLFVQKTGIIGSWILKYDANKTLIFLMYQAS